MTGGPADPQETDPSADAVPDEALSAAKNAFASRTEGEVAELAFDSLLEGSGTAADHTLTFEHPEVTIMVHVVSSDEGVTLKGRVEGAKPVRSVVLHVYGDYMSVMASALNGWFECAGVAHGQVRMEFGFEADTPTIWTDWFRV